MTLFDENFFLFRWLQKLPVPGKLNLLIALIAVTIPLSLGGFWLGMNTLSSVRAYVGGESLWSKAQKDAVYALIKYSFSNNEKDYNEFLELIKIPQGDKMARLELEKEVPNYDIVYKGFIQGGNAPEDLPGMASLFRRFRRFYYIDRSISIWTQGDLFIDELLSLGDTIHTTIHNKPANTPLSIADGALIAQSVARVDAINRKLTVLEQFFAATLGEGARYIKNIILLIFVIAIVFIGIITISLAIFLGKIMARVDKAKSEFVSLASHQLRTPLTIINWYSEKLIRDFSSLKEEKRKEYIHALAEANQRMGNLVDSLLSASQIEMGTFAVNPESVDFVRIADLVVKDLEPTIQRKNLKVDIQTRGVITGIWTDPRLTEMIFQNLISNAVKYTPDEGSITITMTRQRSELLLTVADTGYGIPTPEQPKIYDKLFRSRVARERAPSGTGLGLYITKSAVERSGGKIWLKSVENKGTTFYVTIPHIRR